MIINLKIPDSLYEKYLNKYGSPQHYKKMKDHIEALQDLPHGDRFIILHTETRKKIEKVFQTIIEDGEQLWKEIVKLNNVRVGGIDMDFNTEELARIDMQATFHGKDRETFIREMVMELKDRMLEKV